MLSAGIPVYAAIFWTSSASIFTFPADTCFRWAGLMSHLLASSSMLIFFSAAIDLMFSFNSFILPPFWCCGVVASPSRRDPRCCTSQTRDPRWCHSARRSFRRVRHIVPVLGRSCRGHALPHCPRSYRASILQLLDVEVHALDHWFDFVVIPFHFFLSFMNSRFTLSILVNYPFTVNAFFSDSFLMV